MSNEPLLDMDNELISTLWGLLLLAAALLPSILQIKKKRELARRKSGREEQTVSEYGTTRQTQNNRHDTDYDSTYGQNAESAESSTTRHAEPQMVKNLTYRINPSATNGDTEEGTIDFSGTISSEQHPGDLSLQTVAQGAAKTCDRLKHNIPDAHHKDAQTEQDDDPLAGFDLRHAVVYAEILKPKFGPQSED